MTSRTLLCTALAALALAGCAAPGTTTGGDSGGVAAAGRNDCPNTIRPNPRELCQHSLCAIPVEVVWNATDGKCEVVVGIETLQMAKKNNGAVIEWWLGGPGWQFAAESPPAPFATPIIFKGANAGAASQQFSNIRVFEGGRKVQITNANTDKQQYDYRVKVVKHGPPGTPDVSLVSKDPVILNDN